MKKFGRGGGFIDPRTLLVTSELDGGEWSASRPGRFTPWERAPDTHWIEGRVGPRTDLDVVEKRKVLPLPGLELRPLGHSAHRKSLYRLRCPGSHLLIYL
jgi:hypothetical protein